LQIVKQGENDFHLRVMYQLRAAQHPKYQPFVRLELQTDNQRKHEQDPQ